MPRERRAALLLALAAAAAPPASAFYIPGAFPNAFAANATLRVRVNSLTSPVAELSYDHYSLPYCKPAEGAQRVAENLGELLAGDRIATSPYALTLLDPSDAAADADAPAVLLCQTRLRAADSEAVRRRVAEGYRVGMFVDTLPVTNYELQDEGGRGGVLTGFPVGFTKGPSTEEHDDAHHDHSHLVADDDAHPASDDAHADSDDAVYINNHLEFTVLLHRAEPGIGAPSMMTEVGLDAEALPRQQAPRKSGSTATSSATSAAWNVVGFEVVPCSVAREALPGLPAYDVASDRVAPPAGAPLPRLSGVPSCGSAPPARVAPGELLAFSYRVRFVESATPWVNRWDAYLAMGDDADVHWFAILNSVLLVVFMAGVIALILARNVRRDLRAYELAAAATGAQSSSGGEAAHESSAADADGDGWKLLRHDVFRAPPHAEWLAVCVGSGAQVLAVVAATSALGALGFTSPSARGSLLTAALLLYVLSAGAAGYAAVRTLAWTHAGGGAPGAPPGAAAAAAAAAAWRRVCLRTAALPPGAAAAALALVNIGVRAAGDAGGAVPASLFASLFFLWFLVSVPLCLTGGYVASRAAAPVAPCRANAIPRHVPVGAPSATWVAAAGGALPFGALFMELHFVLGALWQHRAYYAPGFLLLALLLAAALVAEAACVLTYAALAAEEHRWWWRAFLAGASLGLYVAGYVACYALVGPLNLVGFAGLLMFVLYSAVAVAATALAGGALGVAASLAFVTHLFAAVKGD